MAIFQFATCKRVRLLGVYWSNSCVQLAGSHEMASNIIIHSTWSPKVTVILVKILQTLMINGISTGSEKPVKKVGCTTR